MLISANIRGEDCHIGYVHKDTGKEIGCTKQQNIVSAWCRSQNPRISNFQAKLTKYMSLCWIGTNGLLGLLAFLGTMMGWLVMLSSLTFMPNCWSNAKLLSPTVDWNANDSFLKNEEKQKLRKVWLYGLWNHIQSVEPSQTLIYNSHPCIIRCDKFFPFLSLGIVYYVYNCNM